MEKIIENTKPINEKPELVQHNFAVVDKNLEKYIRDGEPFRLSDENFNAFCNMINKTSSITNAVSIFVMVLGIVTLMSTAIPVITAVVMGIQSAGASDGNSAIMFIVPIIITLFMVAFGVAMLILYSKMKEQIKSYSQVIENVRYGQAECYRYKCRRILRYSYYNGDSTNHIYYAELDDFAVELVNASENWVQAKFAYAVIVNMNNKDVFYMFNDME
ncbi:MAG: hypothetical protein ACI4KH_08120 [Oscillospiraceae bacterium]